MHLARLTPLAKPIDIRTIESYMQDPKALPIDWRGIQNGGGTRATVRRVSSRVSGAVNFSQPFETAYL